jgi:hypothetical protein
LAPFDWTTTTLSDWFSFALFASQRQFITAYIVMGSYAG